MKTALAADVVSKEAAAEDLYQDWRSTGLGGLIARARTLPA